MALWGFIVRVLMDPADKVTILDTNRSQSALSYPAQLPFNRAPSAERLQFFFVSLPIFPQALSRPIPDPITLLRDAG
jgi:hypothetical protein